MTITKLSRGEFYLCLKSKLFPHYRAKMMMHDLLK